MTAGMRIVIAALAAVVSAGIGWLAFTVAGLDGAAWSAVALLALLAAIRRAGWAVQGESEPPAPPQAQAGRGRLRRYEELSAQLSWNRLEQRNFDRVLRPIIWRVALAKAADRRGVTGTADAQFLREWLGEQGWFLLDPARPSWIDPAGTRTPGPGLDTLERLVGRIEAL